MKIVRLSQFSGELASQVEHTYESSFPPSQRVAFSHLVSSIASGERSVFVAQDADRVIGFAVTMPLTSEGIYFLEYLAVSAEIRSSGAGSLLLKHVANTLRSLEGAEGILLEVEPPEGPESDPSRRRVRFYLRNGASLIHEVLSFYMPDLSGSGSVPMRLMWLPLIPGKTIGNSSLRECVISIYCDVYEVGMDHPLLRAALKDLGLVKGAHEENLNHRN
jgi:ribosomal protein S18 acetylase RimI-like enzyme